MASKKTVDVETTEVPVEEIPVEQQDTEAEEKAEKTASKKSQGSVKAKVQIVFRDKNTGVIHHPGEVIEVTKKRYDEINTKKAFLKRM